MAEEAVENFLNTNELEIFGNYSSKVKFFSVTLNGIVTDFAVSDYANQILIIITQFQKIGTLITVTKGSVKNLNGSEDIFDLKTICGLDSQECQLAARFLASQMNVIKPILFGICLKNYDPKTLKTIAKVLQENLSS